MLTLGAQWWLPIDVSEHGHRIDSLIFWTHVFMAILFIGWGAYFAYCLIQFRQRPGHQATTKLPKAKASKYSEILVVIVEAVLLLAFSIPIWAAVRGKGHVPDAQTALVVRVVAKQFEWHIHYPGRDGVFGPTDQDLVNNENVIGLDRSDEHGKDDIVSINQMHVPVNQEVLVHLSSRDVIHSFGVSLLRVKQDAVPGMVIPLWFKAIRTSDEARDEMAASFPTDADNFPKNYVAMSDYKSSDGGTVVAEGDELTAEIVAALSAAGTSQIRAAPAVPIEIACAQLCGLGHYRMRGYLHVDTQEQYDQWMVEEEEWLQDDEDDEGF